MLSYHFYTFDTRKVNFWKRLWAQFIDFTIAFFIAAMLTYWFSPTERIFRWSVLWVYLIYGCFMDAYNDGTFGKRLVGLKVVMNNSDESHTLAAFNRNLMKIICVIVGYDILLLPLMKGYSGIHNRIAKTFIVKK